MFKKTLLAFAAATTASACLAGTFYLGPSLQYESISADDNYQVISPRLTFGYGTPLRELYYLAGEIFAVAGTLYNHPDSSPLKNTPSFGLSIVPGILFGEQQSYFYGRLGLVTADFSGQKNNAWGAQAGLGLNIDLTKQIDVRGEYDYTAYENISGAGEPQSNMLLISCLYKFN